MAYEQKNNTGVLFKNDRKREGRNDPDYQGNVIINGESFWISAWVKDGKNGKFFSLAFRPKDDARQVNDAVKQAEALPPPQSDDELPF